MNLLLIHGNGGARSRFDLFEREWLKRTSGDVQLHFPELPGFEGRPLPQGAESWDSFLDALRAVVREKTGEPWRLYGHGIGGSLLLEWARRDWSLDAAAGELPVSWKPEQVILHGCIGAGLEHRFFPKLMQPRWIRKTVQTLIHQPLLRPLWEKKLFLYRERIPDSVRRQFFQDYKNCQAFPVFFDLITPEWYKTVQRETGDCSFYFLWGAKERVVASKHLDFWRKDFPRSTFEVAPGWDHFPMLDQPVEFCDKITEILLERDE